MDSTTGFLTPAVGFLITVAFGFWLSKSGRPYNGILFNIHKLIALGTTILVSIKAYNLFKDWDVPFLIVFFISLVAFCVVVLFLSGAFLSIGNMEYSAVKTIHAIAPALAVVAIGLTVYLLNAYG